MDLIVILSYMHKMYFGHLNILFPEYPPSPKPLFFANSSS